MGSSLSTRLYRVTKAAGRPLPSFSDDDVLDYMVTEAIVLRGVQEDKEAQKQEERRRWKAEHKKMGRRPGG